MQDVGAVGFGLDLNIVVEEQVPTVEGGDNVGEQVLGDIGVVNQWSLTQNSNPFNLGSLIAGAQCSGEGRANRKSMLSMGRQEVESCIIGKRYRHGNASAYLGMPETPENTFFFEARKFVVVGTGVVGCCPAQRASNDGECNEDANSMSVHYNDSLKSMLQELKVGLHVNYTFFETCSVITDIIQDAASYEGTMSSGTDSILQRQATHGSLVDKLFGGPSEYTFPTNVKELIAL
ncbi:hypothetical protein ACE6H2_014942 [Prunus campanulata]